MNNAPHNNTALTEADALVITTFELWLNNRTRVDAATERMLKADWQAAAELAHEARR